MNNPFAACALVLLLAALACTTLSPIADNRPQTTAPQAPLPTSHFAPGTSHFGVAGLIPRNFPNSSADDWLNLYETLPETGALLGVYTNWADSPETAGLIPKVVDTEFELAARYGFTPLVALGFHRDTPGGGLEPTLSWMGAGDRDKFRQAAVAIAAQHQPDYLALGVEVNRFYEYDPAAFTTYPFLDHPSPADLPADYYAETAAHTSRPLAFTEIGWPSAPFTTAPDSEYGGSEEEQAVFVRRFFELTSETNLALALWAFPDDLGPTASSNPAMADISLRHNDGTPKPALAVWQEMVGRER